ncbi:MAG: trypsin-like peptidase domain-containing protein [Saprospiraceae bacterium]|nr:trypsin-like peptidase domain-containing protein [Saprospiraceae bacterium]
MNTKSIIELYKKSVIQIATPYSTGTGFYLSHYDLIVTNEHVVRDNKEVIIDAEGLDKQLAEICFLDEKYDLAFLIPPKDHNMASVPLANAEMDHAEGDEILAVGHPFGLKYTATKGIISNSEHDDRGILYLQHDAALNPGNSGGPLISAKGEIIGVNTFIVSNGNNIGFSLPIHYLQKALQEFKEGNGVSAVRCNSCLNMVFENTVKGQYCHHCGSKIQMISQIDSYEPSGISRTIEGMLEEMGYDIPISRMGPSNWTIKRGSAIINIAYHEKSGLITGDAYLGKLPDENISEIYSYMLHQNFELDGLTFSVRRQDIILSLLIFDQYLNQQTAKQLFDHLSEAADYHDNILVERYGASWNEATH